MAVQNHEGSAGRSSHQFMLRLWLEELGNDQHELRGSVQHVNSGEMRYFRDWATLEAFMERPLGRTDPKGKEPAVTGETNGASREEEIQDQAIESANQFAHSDSDIFDKR